MLIVPEATSTDAENWPPDASGVESFRIIKSRSSKGSSPRSQTLEFSTIETVSDESECRSLEDDVQEGRQETVEMIEESDKLHLIRRPRWSPDAASVDHGKTSLLGCHPPNRVGQPAEAGGITSTSVPTRWMISHAGEQRTHHVPLIPPTTKRFHRHARPWQPRSGRRWRCWCVAPMTAWRPQTLESDQPRPRRPKCRSRFRDQQKRQGRKPSPRGPKQELIQTSSRSLKNWGGDT